jgi:hypothetical protein
MGLLKFLLWTGCAVGLGIFLASHRIEGRTPVEHTQRFWREQTAGAQLATLGDRVEDAWRDARDAVAGEPAKARQPVRERHSADERRALERLITQRSAQAQGTSSR